MAEMLTLVMVQVDVQVGLLHAIIQVMHDNANMLLLDMSGAVKAVHPLLQVSKQFVSCLTVVWILCFRKSRYRHCPCTQSR